MAEQRIPESWPQLATLIRSFAIRNVGDDVDEVTILLRHRGAWTLPMPFPGVGGVATSAPPDDTEVPARPQGQAPYRRAWHTSDFQVIEWAGRRYLLTPMQRLVVKKLWEASEEGTHEVPQDMLLREAGSDSSRLIEIFRRSEAWNTLIVSTRPGYYRLAELPEVDAEGED